MEYKVHDKTYSLSYKELKRKHREFMALEQEEFMARLPEALHLACIISWFKELDRDLVVGDTGIVHGLVHLLHIPNEPAVSYEDVKEDWDNLLYLA